jgi:hypothetical protein
VCVCVCVCVCVMDSVCVCVMGWLIGMGVSDRVASGGV